MGETTIQVPFESILFRQAGERVETLDEKTTSFFGDLNLDQVFTGITEGREEYDLRPFLAMPLSSLDDIAYRHEITKDLEVKELRDRVKKFAKDLRSMRQHLAQSEKLRYEYQKAAWFLDAVAIYCDAVTTFSEELSSVDVGSRGFRSFREYLAGYVKSEAFKFLVADTKKLYDDLSRVTYCVHIRENKVTVSKYAGQPDYSLDVEETFRRFQQGSVKVYRVEFYEHVEMDSVEERITNLVAKLYPDTFLELATYNAHHRDYLDQTISKFDREIQFYLAYLELIEGLAETGLRFCYPLVSESKEINARDTFDLALAMRLAKEHGSAVANDFYLRDRERIFVVSGPNQGGKTTFARTFGQLHYLARLGYKVPGSEANLFLCDRLFTHFEREEHLENLRGKLQDELVRIHEILQKATGNSIVVMNESFSSTTVKDAAFLGREVLRQMIERDMVGVYVTFIDELSRLGPATVSMVSTVVPDNPALRTYKVLRRPADGKAHAIAIAEKYGLTYDTLRRRLAE